MFPKYTNKELASGLFAVIIALILMPKNLIAQQQRTEITGVVLDSLTKEPLSFVSVFFKGTTTGTQTDDAGRFKIRTTQQVSEIGFSSLGYVSKYMPIKKGHIDKVNVMLMPTSYAVKEVVVTPKKEKYKRKGNPAVELVEKLIDRRHINDPKNKEFLQSSEYEKITIALNDFSEEQKKKWLFKKFKFIFDYVDTSEVSGKPILTISIKEKLAQNFYRRAPESNKQLITGIRRAGADEMFNQESLQQFYNEVLKNVNIFDNDIPLMLNRFVSPLSSIGPLYYKYYLIDTIQVKGEKCVDLGFAPKNPESFGFVGHLFVTLDSTYFIKRAELNIPKDINLNYVKDLAIIQEFDRAADGTRLLRKDDLIVEFEMIPNTQGLYTRRTVQYDKYSFSPPESLDIFKNEGNVVVEQEAERQPEAYWSDNRQTPIKKKENAVERLLAQLRAVPVFYYLEKTIAIIISGYIETSPDNNSKFDFGPMNTTISGNSAEGARFRIGGLTTANLNPHLFARGYVAYGTRDRKLKYSGEVEYSFNEKKYHAREFPIHSVKANYTYDINQLGQQYLYTNKDNIFLSLKRKSDTRVTYLRKGALSYLKEHEFGLSYGMNMSFATEYASNWVKFHEKSGNYLPSYNQALAEVKIRFAPGEKFYQTKSTRYPITMDAPIFTASHQFGFKGVLGSKYDYNRTEVAFQKRFWFSTFGYLDVMLRGGKVWNAVPFPMLIIPNASLTYTIQYESYTLMNALEFINDQYASWDLTYFMNGTLFNRIPLIKYMKLREVVSFRGLYGHLSDKNNPRKNANNSLFFLPDYTYTMGKVPYMEVGAGLDNIFKILRIEYVWRLTYRDHPNIDRGGVRFALHFTF